MELLIFIGILILQQIVKKFGWNGKQSARGETNYESPSAELAESERCIVREYEGAYGLSYSPARKSVRQPDTGSCL